MRDKLSFISMVRLMNEIIQEAGDLENIQPFKVTKINEEEYVFNVDDDLEVAVDINLPFDETEVKGFKIPSEPDPFEVYNVGYTVNDVDTQFSKTDYKTLIRIIKTVSDIVVEFANKKDSANAFAIFPANKNAKKVAHGDIQKFNLYKTVMINNIKRMNGDWGYKPAKFYSISGLILYKK